MQQPNRAVISEDLEGLMLVMQGMSKLQKKGGGAPAMGGPPSILDQAKQAGAQALAPQMQVQPGMTPPPQGPAAPEGGIAGIAQNAATGIDISQMKEQQAKEQQAQEAMKNMAMQQQQQSTQMMASGGIAGLPAENMHGFAEGGVLGYAGDEEQGSEVKSDYKKLSDMEGIIEALKATGKIPLYALGSLGKSLDVANRMVTDVASLPFTIPLNQYQAMTNQKQTGYTPFYDVRRPKETQAAPAEVDPRSRYPGQGRRAAPGEKPSAIQTSESVAAQSAPPTASAPPAPPAARPERMAGRAQPNVDLSGVKYGANIDGGIGGILPTAPATAESPEVASILANEARRQALIKARPDYAAQSIAALDADKQARAEAAAQQQKRQGFEGLMALLAGGARGGMRGMGEASTEFNKGVVTQKDAARQANLLDAQMRVKIGELEYARQIGDIDGQNNVMKDIAGIKRQMDQVAAQREGTASVANTAAARLAQEKTEGALDRASRERAAAMQREATGNKENLALFKARSKNLDDAFKRAIAKRSFAPAKAKEEYTALVKEWDALAAQYGLDKKTAPPPPFEGGADAPVAAAAAPPGYKVVGPAPQK